jgi:putative membrane protein
MAETDTTLRDTLAVERTRLANERTLLSYVRTALGLMAGGVGVLELWQGEAGARVAWLLMLAGAAVLLLGVARFISVRRRLG